MYFRFMDDVIVSCQHGVNGLESSTTLFRSSPSSGYYSVWLSSSECGNGGEVCCLQFPNAVLDSEDENISSSTTHWSYITYRIAARGRPSHGHRQHAQKFTKFGCVVFTRDSIYAIARKCYGNSVCLSVCHTGGSVKNG